MSSSCSQFAGLVFRFLSCKTGIGIQIKSSTKFNMLHIPQILSRYQRDMLTPKIRIRSPPNDSGDEIGAIFDGIQTVATETKVDHRFILAVIMQESGGCVRAPTSNFGVRNPGLMQDHDGSATCNDAGNVQTPCPSDTITEMIREGTAGTASGDGLAQAINRAAVSDVSAFYKAARIYNSGSLDPSGDLGAPGATRCYASDIANRLTGWVLAPHGCTLDG